MKEYLIICRSITFAQRASRALYRAGISNQVLRLPVGLVKSGCGYAVKIRSDDPERALRAMEREHMRPMTLFLSENGIYQEVRYDLP